MNRQVLWKLSVTASDESADAVAEFLARKLDGQPSIFTDCRTGKTTVAVYLKNKPDWSTAVRREFSEALKQFAPEQRRSAALPVRLAKLKNEDWAESWKRHFSPIAIGNRLLIRPTWSRRRPKSGQSLVQLDPGMSFGTGQHPTTGFCLRQLARLRKAGSAQAFLDIGTGSGILAICAAKLGYWPVDALDMDPDCVKIARSNAVLNGVGTRVRLRREDVASLPSQTTGRYSLVCANLMANLLLEHKIRISTTVQIGGHLVLAGILQDEFPRIETAYKSMGLALKRSRGEGEWRSGCFERRFWD